MASRKTVNDDMRERRAGKKGAALPLRLAGIVVAVSASFGLTAFALIGQALPGELRIAGYPVSLTAILCTLALLHVLSVVFALLMRRKASHDERELDAALERIASLELERGIATNGGGTGLWTYHPEDRTVWLDETGASLLGCRDAGEQSLEELTHAIASDQAERLPHAFQDAERSAHVHTSLQVSTHKSDAWIECRGRLMKGADGKPFIAGILLDVSDAKHTLERLKRAEMRLRRAVEAFSGPVALWDRNRRLLFWNRAFADAFGLHDTIRPGIGYETLSLARASNVVQERVSESDDQTLMIGMQDGLWYKLVERETPDGGMLSVALEMTGDVLNEEQLTRQQKKLRTLVLELEKSEGQAAELARKYNEEKAKAERSAHTKSAFLANMSHELRTPLNAINGFSEIIANEIYGPLGDKRYKDYATDILTSGQHLLDMINDILDIAKIEAGKMTISLQHLDLVEPVDAAVRMIRRKAEDKGIRLHFDAPEDLPSIDADHRAIRQMMLNLLSNAIKFTDAGGHIFVTIARKNDTLRVAVRDTGVGIAKDDLPRLGQPFEQVSETKDRNYDGTGLGLALTKSFAEMHGGRLAIASEPGKGTQVSFYLPIPKDSANAEKYVA